MHRVLGLVLLAVLSAQAQLRFSSPRYQEMVAMNGTCGAVWRSMTWTNVYKSGNGSCTGVSLGLPRSKLAVAYIVKEETDGIARGAYVQVFTGDVPGPRRQLAACGHADMPALVLTLKVDEFVVACVNAAQTEVVAETFVGNAAGGGSFVVAEALADNITEPAITTFPDGSFAVSWLDHGANTTMRTRRCTSDGTCDDPILDLYSGALLRYHSSTSKDYLVVYTVLHHSLDGWTMIARFADLMVLEGDPVPLAYIPNLSDLYTAQSIIMYRQGFLVVWTGVDDSGEGVNARLFLRNGTALGEMVVANQPTEGAQYHPHLFGPVHLPGSAFPAFVVYSSLVEGEYSVIADTVIITFPPTPPTEAPPSLTPSTAAPPSQSPPSEDTSAPSTATPATETASPERRDADDDDDDQLPPGAIVGIVIGVLAAVLVVVAAVVWFTRAPAQPSNGVEQLPAHEDKEMKPTEPAVHGPA